MIPRAFCDPGMLAALAALALVGALVAWRRSRAVAALLGLCAPLLAGAALETRVVGWGASYHAERGLVGEPVRVTVEPDFGMAAVRDRSLDVSQRRFSVEWSGWVPVLAGGTHRLVVFQYGSVEIRVDGELVLAAGPGDSVDERLWDGRALRAVPLELDAGGHLFELRYEPSRDAAYALGLELVGPGGSGRRLAESMVLPEAPGPGLALGLTPVLVAAGLVSVLAAALLASLAGAVIVGALSRLSAEPIATLDALERSAPVRAVATPALLARTLVDRMSRAGVTPWIALAVVLVVALPALYGRLDERTFYGDEVIHATVAANAAFEGQWFPPMLEGEAYLEKPPLKIWAEAMVFRAVGLGTYAARVLDATAGLATALVILAFAMRSRAARRERDAALGALAALVFLLSPSYLHWHGARDGVQDATMVLATTLAGWLALEARRAEREGRARRAALTAIGAGAALSVGYGVKLVAAFVPAAAIVALEIGEAALAHRRGEPAGLPERVRRLLRIGVPAGMAMGIFTVGYVALVGEPYFEALHGTFVDRAQGELGHVENAGYYLDQLLFSRAALGPWGPLLPVALVLAAARTLGRRGRDTPEAREALALAALTVVIVVGVYSLSVAKNSWYVLAAYPWMALLSAVLALSILRCIASGDRWPRLRALGGLLASAGIVAMVGSVLPDAFPWWGTPPQRSTGPVAEAAARAAGGAPRFYVLEDPELPVLGGPPVEAVALTERRRVLWLGRVLASRGPLAVVPVDFEPPADDAPFFVLVRSERALPATARWLDEIESATAYDDETTLLAGRTGGGIFEPFPVVTDAALPLDVPACGNLRVLGQFSRIAAPRSGPCFVGIGGGVQLRLIGRTPVATRLVLEFDPADRPWSGPVNVLVDGSDAGFTHGSGYTVEVPLPAGTFDGHDVAVRLLRSEPGHVRLMRVKVLPEPTP